MDEDERESYRQEANEEAYNRKEQLRISRNASKHVLDPDRVNEEEEE
jgi:hypothetical protein